jgi:hypothetical protein
MRLTPRPPEGGVKTGSVFNEEKNKFPEAGGSLAGFCYH